MPKILFCSDFDGTLAFKAEVPKENIEAIKKFREAGNMFCIVTGRALPAIKPEIEKQNIPYDLLSCNNGALLFDENDQLVYANFFEKKDAMDLFNSLNETKAATFGMCCLDDLFYGRVNAPMKYADYVKISEITDPDEYLDKHKVPGFYSMFYSHEDMCEARDKVLNEGIGCEVLVSSLRSIDFNAKGISKKTAIHKLMETYPEHKLYVMGDSPNDAVMFIDGVTSCAMSSGQEEVKKIANIVSDSVADVLYNLIDNNQ